MNIKRTMAAAVIMTLVGLGAGCTVTQEQIDALQAEYMSGMAQIDALELELEDLETVDPRVTEILAVIADVQLELDQLGPEISALEPGETAWVDLLKILGIAIAGFVPGGAIAVPFIRSAAAVTKTVFTSIDAGGGPQDATMAKSVLSADPKAYKAFKAYKAAKKALVS